MKDLFRGELVRLTMEEPETRAKAEVRWMRDSEFHRLVEQYIGSKDCTNERIAAEFCMHPRTLQRRLRAEGTSFEDIKDEIRRDLALRYIQNGDMPLKRVAERLGYAETSVLSRSCFRWFSVSPSELRTQRRARQAPVGPCAAGL